MNKPYDLWRLMRPTQWIKNGFVFTGLLFGEMYNDYMLVLNVVVAAIAFALTSSCIYIVNDIADCENDHHHPKKKNRPLPAGKVTIGAAIILSIILGVSGLLIGYWVSSTVAIILLIYATMNLAYSYLLKNIVILDVFCISTGFMLRILAGTVGVGIPPSKWLLLCGLMITLFLGFTKRRAELIALQNNKEEHRQVLQNYGPILLDEIIAICATGVIITYSLYTMSTDTIRIHNTENLIYTVPLVIYALFRYIYLLHHRHSGGDPSRDVLRDPHIFLCVMGWASLTVYLFL